MSDRAAHYTTFKTRIDGITCLCEVRWTPPRKLPSRDDFVFEMLDREGCYDPYLQARCTPDIIDQLYRELCALFSCTFGKIDYVVQQPYAARTSHRTETSDDCEQAAKAVSQAHRW